MGNTPEAGLAQYEAVARTDTDIIHLYKTGASSFPTSREIALTQRSSQPAMLFYNWKPSGSHTWQQIANGAADGNIDVVARSLKAYPHKLFLTIWHEPENDFRSGNTPQSYVAMYRHVVDELRARGVDNVVFVWNMMGATKHRDLYDDLYPGHHYVDWIAWNPYASSGAIETMGQLVNKSASYFGWEGFYVWASNKAPGKPLMLAEWAFNLEINSHGPSALRSGAEELRTQWPNLKAFVYWNSTGTVDYSLGQNTSIGRAYTAAYAQFANDPYFNSTPTQLALAVR